MPNAFPPQTSQQRFVFQKHSRYLSPGDPEQYTVVDGGGSMNSAGFVGSSSGAQIGKIVWDPVTNAWFFRLDELRFANLDINSVDAQQITNFINSLAKPVTRNPLV